MITEINSENKITILYLMRSVGVCLDIFLHEPAIKEKLRFKAIDNVVDILINDEHACFRDEVLKYLDPATAITFKTRQALAKILPAESIQMTLELLLALQRCEQKFLEDFVALIANEDPHTQLAASGLLKYIFEEEIINKYFQKQEHCYGDITKAHISGHFYLEWYSFDKTCKPCYGGGYGYGGYGYGGYGYGGYGYGGYGYGGYGYGGYGYGGYGYGGYGYGGYGYGGYNPEPAVPYANHDTRERYAELWDDQDFIWLNQSFVSGVRNAEGMVWAFRNPSNRFTPEEGRLILSQINVCSGDHDQLLFRALSHAAIKYPEIYSKLISKPPSP